MATDQKERAVTGQNSQQTADQEKEQFPEVQPDDRENNPSREQKQQQEKSSEKTTRKEQKKKQKQEKRQNKKPRRRIFPIWLRIIVVLVFSAAALVAGLMIGYGIIGDGNPTDALEWDTWQHIIDIVAKE
ncbi:DNA-directed RNA polymerase subunit beta [Lentibacillus salinarum]|uniref:DNA-directed RNA polymerase subunit beta n=1 Tax=Lentibacillus salinarum TaxID=446820 RepID=A0ABW3ZXY5_9BACI